MVVLPSMDDQLLPLFRDWVIDVMYVKINFLFSVLIILYFSGEIASKPANPLVDSYKSQTSFRDNFQEYKDIKELNRGGSTSPEKPKPSKRLSAHSSKSHSNENNEELGEEMTEL